MSARENIAKNIVSQLDNMTDPSPNLVSREKFDIQKLAITQFPAILVVTANEEREDLSTDTRVGLITYELRCYVRGSQIDTQINELVERIEETIEVSRNRDLTLAATNIHNVSSQVVSIEKIDRELPLGEAICNVNVRYTYKKGVL
tara:strand:+ start:94 stop:531 length:438 start_codon:yes stop_codon:yes gene_type:complete